MRVSPVLVLTLALSVGCFVTTDDTAKDDTGTEGPVDADGDGFTEVEDCDDDNAEVNPDADELCNEIDDDCDGEIDESDAVDATAWLPDNDGDGYGDRNTDMAIASCEPVSGHVADATDCDDDNADINPAADETCNGVDDDCDNEVDEDALDATTWYLDYDEDGYGGFAYKMTTCDQNDGWVDNDDDCDDLDAAVYPGAAEYCNGVDDDCDKEIDEDDAVDAGAWYPDADGDGYGSADEAATMACEQPTDFVADNSDCIDSDANSYPDAPETCDGYDNDCDGTTDEDDAIDAIAWFEDADGDGYGWFYDPATYACAAPSGFSADNTDCDDDDAAVSPADGCSWATIYDLQTGAVADGDPVTVVGWVMHDAVDNGFHVADSAGAYNGIWVYTNNATMLEGDEVLLQGSYMEYYDLSEISVAAPSTDITLLDTGATIPAATSVTTADLADSAVAETYEGVLVTVSGVTVEDSDLGYNEWSIDDDVVIDDYIFLYEGDLAEGGTFTSITGLLYYSYGAYKLLPRYDADLVGYTAPPCAADACVDDLIVGDLVITEVMFNPNACSDSACEWFEVYNASGGSVDLDGLTVEDAGGNTATVTGSSVMADGSWIVLAIGDSSSWAYTGFTPDGYYGSTVSLGNTGDQVIIANSAGTLDEAAAYASGATSAGYSYSLDLAITDTVNNDDSAYWCEALTAIGTTGDYGTPGAVNDSCI